MDNVDNLVYNYIFPVFIGFFNVYNFEDKMWATSDVPTFFVHFYIQEYSDYSKDNKDYFICILHFTMLPFCKIHYVNKKGSPFSELPNFFYIDILTIPACRRADVLLIRGRNRFQIPYPCFFCILPQSYFPQKSELFLRNRLRVHGTHRDFPKYFH